MIPTPAIGGAPPTLHGINAFGCGRGRQRFDTMTELACEAEAAGCAAVWTSELYSRSATVPMTVRELLGRSSASTVNRNTERSELVS
jgi:hypothetical protein